MVPSRKLEKLVGGVLARYQEIFGILIYAYCFLGNHYHLLIRAPLCNTDEFEENLNREIARRVNWKNHREGKFWARRYDDLKVVDVKSDTIAADDLLEALLYVTTNPVKHGLVKHPKEWPGLISFEQTLSERKREFSFHQYSAKNPEDRVTRHSLVLTPLPKFEGLSKEKRGALLEELITARSNELVKKREAAGLGFLGAHALKEQVPGNLPREIACGNRPYCYSKNPKLIKEFKIEERCRRLRYKEASARYRLGDLLAKFPEFSFKPPLNRKPRIRPFVPFADDYFKKVA